VCYNYAAKVRKGTLFTIYKDSALWPG